MKRWFWLLLAVCVALLLAGLAGAIYYAAWNTHSTSNRLQMSTILLNRVNATGDENLKRQMAFLLAQDVADTADNFLLFRTTAFRAKIVQAAAVIGEPPYLSEEQRSSAHVRTVQDIHAIIAAYEKVVAQNEAAMRSGRGGRLWLGVWKITPAKLTAGNMASPIVPNERFSVIRLWNASGASSLLMGSSAPLVLAGFSLLVGLLVLYFRYKKFPKEFSDELRRRLCFLKKGESFGQQLGKWWLRAVLVTGGIVLAWFMAWMLFVKFPCTMRLPFLFLHGVVTVAIAFMLAAYGIFLQRTPSLSQHSRATCFWVISYAWVYIVAAVVFLMYRLMMIASFFFMRW